MKEVKKRIKIREVCVGRAPLNQQYKVILRREVSIGNVEAAFMAT